MFQSSPFKYQYLSIPSNEGGEVLSVSEAGIDQKSSRTTQAQEASSALFKQVSVIVKL